LSIIVFTDGAAKGNPGPGGWGVIVVTPEQHVRELGGGSPHTTNNRMELSGAIAALEHVARQSGPVAIYTDSTYVIQGITQWVWGWRRRGWKTSQGGDWRWVRGHVGTPGNERADEISVAFALQQAPDLYDGPFAGYPLPILELPDDTALPKRPAGSSSGTKTKAAAYSYVSIVDDVPMRHLTWSECEGRVKGRSGARFKKAVSAADEVAILRGWGIDPYSLQ
jgi:ribonuclease HI